MRLSKFEKQAGLAQAVSSEPGAGQDLKASLNTLLLHWHTGDDCAVI